MAPIWNQSSSFSQYSDSASPQEYYQEFQRVTYAIQLKQINVPIQIYLFELSGNKHAN
jgi:hypothetical protein